MLSFCLSTAIAKFVGAFAKHTSFICLCLLVIPPVALGAVQDNRQSASLQRADTANGQVSVCQAPSRLASSSAGASGRGLGNVSDQEHAFYELGHRYLLELYKFRPTQATYLGLHDYDHLLEDVSQESRARELAFKVDYLSKFETVDASQLTSKAQDDLELIKQSIKASIFEISELQEWRRNPDLYSSATGTTLFPLMKRQFAAPEARLNDVIAREKEMPRYLADGRRNIDRKAVPRIYAELASEQLPGIIDFFEKDVKNAFKDVQDKQLLADFDDTNAQVIAALKQYKSFVSELLADKEACLGQYALGKEKFSRLLRLSEMIDEPVDSLLVRGKVELSRLQAQFKETSRQLNSKSSTRDIFQSISSHHPPVDNLLPAVRGVLGEVRSFILEHDICTIPGAEDLRVEETPPFMRATTVAAMDGAGPFEKVAKEAFYFVTLPEKGWDKEKVEEHMRAYSYPDLLSTTIHEAYPGHYVQDLWEQRLSSELRKTMGCGSNAEGWAHYCEQMVLDEGFHKGDKELRLVQLHDALLRCCRYIVAIEMHTRGMTVEQAVQFFVQEGWMEKANAEVEAKRGTVDPTYLVYTLGKLEILKLREDLRSKLGDRFSLKQFHDAFLSIGDVPLPVVRREMLSPLD